MSHIYSQLGSYHNSCSPAADAVSCACGKSLFLAAAEPLQFQHLAAKFHFVVIIISHVCDKDCSPPSGGSNLGETLCILKKAKVPQYPILYFYHEHNPHTLKTSVLRLLLRSPTFIRNSLVISLSLHVKDWCCSKLNFRDLTIFTQIHVRKKSVDLSR